MSSDNSPPSDRDFSDEGEGVSSQTNTGATAIVVTPEEEQLKGLREDVLLQMSIDKKELARQKRYLFIGAGTFAGAFLLVFLLLASCYLLQGKEVDISMTGNWQALVAVDAVFILLAFIPLSIFWSLVKIIHTQQNGNDTQKTDGEKLADSLTATLSSAKELITVVLGAIKNK
ncbi:MAG: hypothetical protein ABF689_08460 [Gluconobacter cerinus]|uniref:hypothetical protein n=1 Tax=Gluconobacter cerinus TaxID=38307 RepID=UPI0039E951E7